MIQSRSSRCERAGRRGALLAMLPASGCLALLLVAPRSAHAERRFVPETREYEAQEREEWRERERREVDNRVDIGFDAEGAAIVAPPRSPIGATLTGGSGFKLRVGDQIRFPALRLTPEVGYG